VRVYELLKAGVSPDDLSRDKVLAQIMKAETRRME
jgi:hypothetical protein